MNPRKNIYRKLRWMPMLLALLFLAHTAVAQSVERSFSVRPGAKLDLRMETGGDITIKGWDQDEIAVRGERRGRDAEDISVEFDERNGGLIIRTEYEHRRRSNNGSLNFTINVPKQFNVELRTMGGDVEITDVSGTFNGETMGGRIELAHLAGEVNMSTMGGEIWVHDAELDGSVSTMGGQVRIEDVKGNLQGSTMGGRVEYRNVESRAGDRPTKIKTMGGAINVEDAKAGADVETMGGAIHIRSANEYVKAKTMGGDIDVDRLDGWIEATTMGGDIEVMMVGNPNEGDRHVELSSMGGDIIVTVPDGLAMQIDVEIKIRDNRWNNRNRDYRIVSDFDVQVEEEEGGWRDEADYILRAEGRTGSGKNLIRIRTVNGNVYLKRGQ